MSDGFTTWQEARLGKFTASEVHKLMSKEKSGGMFSKGAMTYIKSRVAEFFTQISVSDFESEATAHGNLFEVEAVKAYQKANPSYTIEYFGNMNPMFFEYGHFAGGSPDALVNDDGMAEIKCPFNSTNHIDLLLCTDLKKLKPEYYYQIQMNLLITDRQWCDLVSYNDRMLEDEFKLKVIRIERNEEDITEIRTRLTEATRLFNEMIRSIRSVPTPNLIEAQ